MNADLTATVRDIAAVIGREPALALAGKVIEWERKGKRGRAGCIYIPKTKAARSRLDGLVTPDEAQRLREAFPGELLKITCPTIPVRRFRDETVRRLTTEGWSYGRIADAVGVTERYVRFILAR